MIQLLYANFSKLHFNWWISSTKGAKTDANFNCRIKLFFFFILLLTYRISLLKVIHSPVGPPQEYPRFTLPSVASATKSVPLPDWSNLQEHNWMVQWKRQPLESRYSQTWWTVPLSQSCTLSLLFSPAQITGYRWFPLISLH